MRAKLISIFVFLLMLLPVCIVSGEEHHQESLRVPQYLVISLKPSDTDASISSILTDIELQLKVDGIILVPSTDGHWGGEYDLLKPDSSDSFKAVKSQIMEIERQINDLNTTIEEAKESMDVSVHQIEDISSQLMIIRNELKEIEARNGLQNKEISLLKRNLMGLTDVQLEQSEKISELKNDENAIYQYINKSISGSNRFIALIFIILLMIVFVLTLATLKERFFSQTNRWL